jgi:Zn-dependent protease/predicted transcriptional regulator
MNMRGFRVGRLFGIDVRIDWSWAFIFVLMTWNLAAVFALWHPTWSPLEALVVAVAASLAFFLCILLHELAHSLAAQAYGTRVHSITLFLFGGVSDIEREPRSPGAEFITAIVGPLTSILLGVIFISLASAVTPLPAAAGTEEGRAALMRLGPFSTLLVWLGPINVVIGAFNLIPAFPLDGGRVLRAILWTMTGNLRRATRGAAAVGQVIGWLFIAAGIGMTFGLYVPFFGTGLVGGLWIAFIGWFIQAAATQATARLALDDALTGMTVAHLMQPDATAVPPALSVASLVQDYLVRGTDRALPVTRADELLGLVGISDVRRVPADAWSTTAVSDVMRRVNELSIATPDQMVAEAFAKMARLDVDQLPVVSEGRLVGMLRRRDVARWLELAWTPAAAKPSAPAPGAGAPTRRADERHFPPGREPHPGRV